MNPAAAAAAIADCEVSVSVARSEIPAEGGEFALAATLSPPGCPAPVSAGVPWLKVADASRLRFTAGENPESSPRDGVITVGSHSFFIRQASMPQIGLAAAPSRLVFGVNRKGKTNTRVFTAWSERDAASFVVRPGHPWLVVKPKEAKSKNGRQSYEITIRPDAELAPGRYDSSLSLSTLAAPGKFVTIPVVVEVEGLP